MQPTVLTFFIALNVASCVGVIAWSKNLYLEYLFPFAATLGTLAVCALTVVLLAARLARRIKGPRVAAQYVWTLAPTFAASVVMLQSSLLLGPIGTHEAVFVLAVPAMAGVALSCEGCVLKAEASRRRRQAVYVSLAVIAMCVLGFVLKHRGFTSVQLVTTLLAVASAGTYWLTLSTLSQELECSVMWLMATHMPLSLLATFGLSWAMDGVFLPSQLSRYACAWQTLLMSVAAFVVYQLTTAVLLSKMTVVSFSLFTVPTFAIIAVVAHFKYGERLSFSGEAFAFAALVAVSAFITIVVTRREDSAELTDLMRRAE